MFSTGDCKLINCIQGKQWNRQSIREVSDLPKSTLSRVQSELVCYFLRPCVIDWLAHRSFCSFASFIRVKRAFLVNSRESTLAQLLLLVLLVLHSKSDANEFAAHLHTLICVSFGDAIDRLSLLWACLRRFKGSSFPFLSLFLPPCAASSLTA